MKYMMGVYDAPEKQQQPTFEVNLLKGNIAVFGGPMSGKSTLIKTLLVRLHQKRKAGEEEVYIVDFGGSLGNFGNMPLVCAYFDNSNEENIKRVFRVVEKRLKDNGDILGGRSYQERWEEDRNGCPPHVTFIIENINAFLSDERYETYREALTKLCRDGLSKGLTVVITGRDTSGIGRLLTNFAQKVGFGLSSEDYVDVFGCKVIPPMRLPGRGIVNIESQNYEFQCFLPFDKPEQEGLAPFLAQERSKEIPRMEAFEAELTKDNIGRQTSGSIDESGDRVVLGLDYYEHNPIVLDYGKTRGIAIYGKSKFGKTNLLTLILEDIRKKHPDYRYVYLDDGRQQLRKVMKWQSEPNEQSRIEEETKKGNWLECGNNEVYMRKPKILSRYLEENQYVTPTDKGDSELFFGDESLFGAPAEEEKTLNEIPKNVPPTVFVIDNKVFYQGVGADTTLLERFIPELINTADDSGHIVILADVRTIAQSDNREIFNACISVAFLLDNLGEFVAERGSKTVFAGMEAKEMKAAYARCTIGDGFIYEVDSEKLQKFKMIKVT